MSAPELKPESAHVTRLLGAPGSGKTYTLTREHATDERDERGVKLEDVRYLTFTASGRTDAMEDMAEIYPTAEEDEVKRSVKTLHGCALSAVLAKGMLDLSEDGEDSIIRPGGSGVSVFEWFFKQNHPDLEYEDGALDPAEVLADEEDTSAPIGNQILRAYNYCRSKVWALKHYHHGPFEIDLPRNRVLEVMEDWEEFKDEQNLYQDDDYVYLALHNALVPDAEVLYIDEFQDLSPLQYELFKIWRDSPQIKRVYIAGDDKQAIYGFRGADPKYFTDTPVDTEEHGEMSRRCPESVMSAACSLFDEVPSHDVTNVTAKDSGGRVEHRSAEGREELASLVEESLQKHGKTFLLARTNRQAFKMAWALRETGHPYTGVKEGGPLGRWSQPMPQLLGALRALRDGRGLEPFEAEARFDEDGRFDGESDASSPSSRGRQVRERGVVGSLPGGSRPQRQRYGGWKWTNGGWRCLEMSSAVGHRTTRTRCRLGPFTP